MLHPEPVQLELVTCAPPLQESPQALQFVVVPSVTSQPLAGSPSQSANPALQLATAQVPLAQAGVALFRLQALLQKPQWATDVLVFVSQSGFASQSAVGAGHVDVTQVPPWQVWFALHTLPQLPQFAGSVFVNDSQPSVTSLLQF